MKNPKILLYALGGVTALIALGFGFLIWSGWSDRGAAAEELETAVSQADRLTRLPIRPGLAAIRDVNSNRTVVVAWRTNTLAVLARGDRTFEPTTPPAFKTFLISEARRLSALPGTAAGKLVKPDFPFGFKDYITGGVLPTVADLPRLQREWSDISTVVEILATNRVSEILDVRVTAAAATDAAEESKSKKKKKSKAKAASDGEALQPDITRFTVEFLARPEALVGAVNGFVACPRYVVVESMRFAPEKDALAEELGAEEKPGAAAQATGRRARRRAAAQAAAEKAKGEGDGEKRKTGVVTDPATVAPTKVTMAFAVYDFKTGGVANASGGLTNVVKEVSK